MIGRVAREALLAIPKPQVNAGSIGSAATMLRAVRKFDAVFPILDRAKFENARQTHNARAMDANEPGRVQALFKRLHSFA